MSIVYNQIRTQKRSASTLTGKRRAFLFYNTLNNKPVHRSQIVPVTVRTADPGVTVTIPLTGSVE